MIWTHIQKNPPHIGDEVFIYHNGKLMMKRWLKPNGEKRQPTALLNEWGWGTVWVT